MRTRYSVLMGFSGLFILLSFIVRTILLIWSWGKWDVTFTAIVGLYSKGLIFDIGVAAFMGLLYSIYLLILPQRLNKSLFNKILTYVGFFITLLIAMFAFFAEFTFWGEFESRFNFIAVDYLVYTYEVINNINQSYPLPYLIGGMLLATAFITWLFARKGIFKRSFISHTSFIKRLSYTCIFILLAIIYILFINNSWCDNSPNRYKNELSKAGIYSFFAAYKNNELDYNSFYLKESNNTAFSTMNSLLAEPGAVYINKENSILRQIKDTLPPKRLNVIMVTIESFSADFMQYFGNTQSLTPHIDSIARKSILFTNMFATGTRTVRGMEALTLAVPPTPGSSIVRRPDNDNLYSIGSVFKNDGYETTFFYGGDGYFDNMNQFFGGNGFNIVDRGRKGMIGDKFTTTRTFIPDSMVHFENAWGICDEDLYDMVLKDADRMYNEGKPFFNFVMTTSNHRPYTYPAGKIDIPSGSGRDGAVKYTDYAINAFLKKASTAPWFANTVFVFVADHCAGSAGKNEIQLSQYHIPCIIYNLPGAQPDSINKLCSQIDLYPTLLPMMNVSYTSNFYGKNVLLPGYQPRSYMGTYQKLGYLVNDTLTILGPLQQAECFVWNRQTNDQTKIPVDSTLLRQAIANYQTAYYLYKTGGMKALK